MKDNAKEQFRAKIYQLIDALKNNIMSLQVETSQPTIYDNDPMGGIDIDPEGGTTYQMWEWDYRLDPQDKHTVDFTNALTDLDAALYSKEGARFLPRGLYRALIEFGDKILPCKKWIKWSRAKAYFKEKEGMPSVEELKSSSSRDMKKAHNAETIKQIIREIYFFENERDESEESFFGDSK
jgi:hypothetical protein